MTTIEAFFEKGIPHGLRVSGHSGYGEEGSDIVCSAISVLVQTLYIGLSDVGGYDVEAEVDEGGAAISLEWGADAGEACRILTESVFRALRGVAGAYGDYAEYVEVSL